MTRSFFPAILSITLFASILGARQSGIQGVDLPADPLLPIPLYHDTRARRLADELAKLKPTVVRAAVPLGVGPTAITLLVTSDALFPGEINGSLGRIVFYSGIINGFVKSRIVHKGMI